MLTEICENMKVLAFLNRSFSKTQNFYSFHGSLVECQNPARGGVCSSPGKIIIFKLGLSLSSDEYAGGIELELAGHLENKTPLNLNAPQNLNALLNLLLGSRDRYHNSLQI